jgi:hypothetical protein
MVNERPTVSISFESSLEEQLFDKIYMCVITGSTILGTDQ